MKDINQRQGCFSLGSAIIKGMPELAMAIMGKMIIFRAEFGLKDNQFKYYAVSPEFEILGEGERIPDYQVKVLGDDVSFVRIS